MRSPVQMCQEMMTLERPKWWGKIFMIHILSSVTEPQHWMKINYLHIETLPHVKNLRIWAY